MAKASAHGGAGRMAGGGLDDVCAAPLPSGDPHVREQYNPLIGNDWTPRMCGDLGAKATPHLRRVHLKKVFIKEGVKPRPSGRGGFHRWLAIALPT